MYLRRADARCSRSITGRTAGRCRESDTGRQGPHLESGVPPRALTRMPEAGQQLQDAASAMPQRIRPNTRIAQGDWMVASIRGSSTECFRSGVRYSRPRATKSSPLVGRDRGLASASIGRSVLGDKPSRLGRLSSDAASASPAWRFLPSPDSARSGGEDVDPSSSTVAVRWIGSEQVMGRFHVALMPWCVGGRAVQQNDANVGIGQNPWFHRRVVGWRKIARTGASPGTGGALERIFPKKCYRRFLLRLGESPDIRPERGRVGSSRCRAIPSPLRYVNVFSRGRAELSVIQTPRGATSAPRDRSRAGRRRRYRCRNPECDAASHALR